MCLALDRGRPGFVRNFTCSALLGCLSKRLFYFTYWAFTVFGSIFQLDSVIKKFCNSFGVLQDSATDPSTPAAQRLQAWHAVGLGFAPFAHHYLGYLLRFLFLRVLRCFTSLRTPRPKPVPTHDGRWVPPFGNPRIKALLAAPRGISQPQTSFIGPVCQGIHHTPSQAAQQQDHCPTRGFPDSKIARRQILTLK